MNRRVELAPYRPCLWRMVCLMASILMMGCGSGDAGDPPELFAKMAPEEIPADFPERAASKQHRFTQLNAPGVQHIANQGGLLRLTLFEGLEVTARLDKIDDGILPTKSYRGQIVDDPGSTVSMSFQNGVLKASVVTGNGRQYQISHVRNGTYVVFEIQPLVSPLKGN